MGCYLITLLYRYRSNPPNHREGCRAFAIETGFGAQIWRSPDAPTKSRRPAFSKIRQRSTQNPRGAVQTIGPALACVVTNMDPAPAGVGLAFREHGHGRRVGVFHPLRLPEPGVRLSPHPAPIRPACRLRRVASARTIVSFRARSFRGMHAVSAEPGSPAAIFYYSRDRRGEHPQSHLEGYSGILQADAYDGFNKLYLADRTPGPIREATC